MKKRYALVGTGSRAGMFVEALSQNFRDNAELVGFCDLSQTRMDWYQAQLAAAGYAREVPTYLAGQFETMVAETRPDTVIVTTIDRDHHLYIVRAMELGCDVISEKPMTTDAERARAIFDAIARTGKSLRVTFNYRYAPAYTRLRELIQEGRVGKPLSVDFTWLLDTSHGADYFRRWHREKENSGGLLVHKATHHFDLVNWWLDDYPSEVMAMGSLLFYGRANAEARGERYSYSRYTDEPKAQEDPFALDLHSKAVFEGLYLDAEPETGYVRDRNVFGDPITIEDTMNVSVRYRQGALLSYHLVAYSPWEGLHVAVTGTKGRLELDIKENINHLQGDGRVDETSAAASKGAFKQASLRHYPMFGQGEEISVPVGEGGHGGADPVMLEQIFSPTPPPDPYSRAASHLDGAASVMTGIAANRSIETGQVVKIDDLFPLQKVPGEVSQTAT